MINKITFNERYNSIVNINEISKKFMVEGFVRLENFFSKEVLNTLNKDIDLFKKIKTRRDFIMPGYDTPRNLSVIGGKDIINHSSLFLRLYGDNKIKNLIGKIVNRKIHDVNHQDEFMVINFLDQTSDTHGWHLDDPDLAFVIILKAPKNAGSAEVEVINDWGKKSLLVTKDFCEKDFLSDRINKSNVAVKKLKFSDGDAYLLHASKALHRVTPIIGNDERIALNMAYSFSENQYYGKSATLLYGNNKDSEHV